MDAPLDMMTGRAGCPIDTSRREADIRVRWFKRPASRQGSREKMLRILRLTVALALSCEVLLTGALTTSAATTTIAANWTQSGYNAQHTGYNPLETTLTRSNVGHLVKAFSVPVQDAGPSPLVVNGIAYVSAAESGVVEAVNATTGAPVWTNFAAAASSAPVFAMGRLWVGVDDPGLAAFDAKTGAPFGPAPYPGNLADFFDFSAPSAAGGIVYAGGDDGELAAVNASTGSVRWHRWLGLLDGSCPNPNLFDCSGPTLQTPAVSPDRTALYVGTSAGDVWKINASTGATIWKRHLDNCIQSAVTVSGSMLYVGGCNLYALSAATGTVIWHSSFFGNGVTAPAVANGLVFAGSQGTYSGVAAFNALSGKRVWTSPVGPVYTAPTVANGVVYVTSVGEVLEMLNSSTGAQIGMYFNARLSYVGTPIEVNGMVYVSGMSASTTFLVALKP